MPATAAKIHPHDDREFAFTRQDFLFIQRLVKEQAGIALSDVKEDMVYARLAKRLRTLRMSSFKQYCEYVEHNPGGELSNLINAITTNLTFFFREQHHFDHLATEILPALVQRKGMDRRLRIWSAGCSSGEEPYSIAITLLQHLPNPELWDVKILASDLDSNMVAHAARGVYSQDRVKGMETKVLHRWFRKGKGSNAGLVRAHPDLQQLIAFRRLNLMDAWPMQQPFDVIFCRNVMIYFDKPTQARLLERYANQLHDGGHLFVGHSESLYGVTDRFRLVGKTIYQKT